MRKIGILLLTAIIAVAFSGCGAPAGNTNSGSNANANTGKTTAAAPTAESLLALDKQANEAYFKGDVKFFEGFLSDKFGEVHGGARYDKAAVLKMFGDNKCDVKPWTLEEPKMSMVDADTYVLSYKGTFDGSCTMGGKTEKIPSPIRAATVFVRNGDKWQAAFHGENEIIDPKAAPAAPPAKPEAKKEEAKPADKPADKPASNSNTAPAAPAPAKSANTDALVAVEKAGWEAWKAKDGKKLDEITAKNLTVLSPDGSWMTRAEILKFWVEMPCENIKNVDVKDGFGTDLSPTVGMLTFVGWADGTCFGQKNGSQDAMSIYVKEGDAWKLAFSFSAASM
jgi:hypothetical protein